MGYASVTMNPRELLDHPRNRELWGQPVVDDDFLASVERYKVLVPVELAGDGLTILSGHRRVAAALKLGLEAVECHVNQEINDEDEQVLRMIAYNKARSPTPSQVAYVAALQAKLLAKSEERMSINKAVGQNLGLSPRTAGEAIRVGKAMIDAKRHDMAQYERISATVNKSGFRQTAKEVAPGKAPRPAANKSIGQPAAPAQPPTPKPEKPRDNPLKRRLDMLIGSIDGIRGRIDEICDDIPMCDEADMALRHLDDARKQLLRWSRRVEQQADRR